MSSSTFDASDDDDASDDAAQDEVLTGELIDGTLYLVNHARQLVYSSTERDADDDEPRLVGAWRNGRVESLFPYAVAEEDHCETPALAYEHIAPLLDVLCGANERRNELRIWDPFYCTGAVKRHLAALGFTSVHNVCEDFWQLVDEKREPACDVIVTNPPFSGDNPERLLRYLLSQAKPFLLLVPNWLYTKAYYAALDAARLQPLLLVPSKRYTFVTPKHLRGNLSKSAHSTAPFVTMWFCFVHSARDREAIARTYEQRKQPANKDTAVQIFRSPALLLPQFKSSFDKTRKKSSNNEHRQASFKSSSSSSNNNNNNDNKKRSSSDGNAKRRRKDFQRS